MLPEIKKERKQRQLFVSSGEALSNCPFRQYLLDSLVRPTVVTVPFNKIRTPQCSMAVKHLPISAMVGDNCGPLPTVFNGREMLAYSGNYYRIHCSSADRSTVFNGYRVLAYLGVNYRIQCGPLSTVLNCLEILA